MGHIREYDEFIRKLIKRIPQVIKSIEIEKVDTKSGDRDLVTAVDKGLEEFLRTKILERFPDHEILGEETYDPEAEYSTKNLWVIDPIDGTTNFVKQRNDFCTIISYFENGKAMLTYIYEVMKDDLYHGIRNEGVFLNGVKLPKPKNIGLGEAILTTDIRRLYMYRNELFDIVARESFAVRSIGTSGLEGTRVATGRTGGYVNYTGGPWDYSPFFLFSRELGLVFKTLNGEDLEINSGYTNFILCTERVYKELILDRK